MPHTPLHPPPARLAGARLLAAALGIAALPACATTGFVPDRAHGFVPREAAGHKYFVYVPAGWSADKSWPVVVYLHGGGERGDDGVKPTQVGLGPVVQRSAGAFPFVAVFPQCDRSIFWAEGPMRARVLAALDDTIKEFHGDPDRVYLTGNSMGGFGTWLIGARNPGRFAALVPIAGGVRPPRGIPLPEDEPFRKGEDPEVSVARAVAKLPVWIFHGASDWVVPPANSRRMLDRLKEAAGPAADVKYSELPGVGHNSEDTAYAMPELWTWLGGKRRPAP